MPFYRLYYHLVWATQGRASLIESDFENGLHRMLAEKCKDFRGMALAINGMQDHVHVVISAPPTISPAEIAKRLKGSSSRFLHLEYNIPFAWQSEYGADSISYKKISMMRSAMYKTKKNITLMEPYTLSLNDVP